jgi:RIO-like serine/threonine protein kinase
VEENGVRAVVKDFSGTRFLFRNVVGRFLIWREGKALRRLEHTHGVPRLYRIIQGVALVAEEVRGRPLEGVTDRKEITATFFADLKDLVERFHRKGVAHCDLKRAANILLGDDGKPYVVDWAACICESELRIYPLRLIYRRFLQDDHLAIIKRKLQYTPEAVSHREQVVYQHRSGPEKMVRALRDRLRRWLQRLA